MHECVKKYVISFKKIKLTHMSNMLIATNKLIVNKLKQVWKETFLEITYSSGNNWVY